MSDVHSLKPAKKVFVLYRLLIRAIVALFLFASLFVVSTVIEFSLPYLAIAFIVGYFLVVLFLWYQLNVSYRKEEYIFYHDRMVRKGGGIFHDKKTELIVKNITHVTANLPFVENSIFRTGNVMIESAGSGDSEIILKSVSDPLGYYKYVENIMKQGGFSLSKNTLIQEERPCSLGVFLEAFNGIFGPLVIGLFFILPIAINFFVVMKVADLSTSPVSLVPYFFGLAALFLIMTVTFTIKYLDIKRRLYKIYEDVIVYSEGFLTKNYSFIPMENLSDSSLVQTLIEKIFGIYDVKISCQGTGQEIHFRNIKNGPQMEKTIDDLIQNVGPVKNVKVKKQNAISLKVKEEVEKIDIDSSYVDNMRMMMGRSLFLPLLALIPLIAFSFFILIDMLGAWFIWGAITIFTIISVKVTEFIVGKRSIGQKYNFLNRENVEFSCDKIMGINIKENFIDKWFGTITIMFWSIGTGKNIVFKNVRKSDGLIDKIASKAGVRSKDLVYSMDSDFSFGRMLKSSVFSSIFVAILSAVVIVLSLLVSVYFISIFVVILIGYIFAAIYLPIHYGRSKLKFYSNYVYFEKGVFFRNYYFSLFNNIKGISSLKYIVSGHGNIRFNVAGESKVGNNKKNQAIVSNGFAISYIDQINIKNTLIDLIFDKRPSASRVSDIEKNIKSHTFRDDVVSSPDIGPAVFMTVLISVIIFPLLVLLPISLLFVIWSVRVRKYLLQDRRVVSKWGIFYKKQLSILYSKVDHVNSDEGILNKMFHNGNVSVNTTGSSASELDIKNIPNYVEFYKKLSEDVR